MTSSHRDIALALSRQHETEPRLLFHSAEDLVEASSWRSALREAGVPVLELNDAHGLAAEAWLNAAQEFSAEFLTPVVVLGGSAAGAVKDLRLDAQILVSEHPIEDPDWLRTRQVALTRAVETSTLNQEFRRSRGRTGWIRIGWQPETALAEGNELLLAWSSPLPLRRIRDFAARCPEITLVAPDAEAITAEVAAQGISVAGWRFAVK